MRKIAYLQRTRRLRSDHFYLTEGNMHVTFIKRPSAATIDAIRKMATVAADFIHSKKQPITHT